MIYRYVGINSDHPEPAADQIGLNNHQYYVVFGETLGKVHKTGRQRGIVRIERKTSHGVRVEYRRYRGMHIKGNEAHLDIATAASLSDSESELQNGFEINLTSAGWSGRVHYYWSHPDDSLRVSYRLGLLSLVLGLISVWSIF